MTQTNIVFHPLPTSSVLAKFERHKTLVANHHSQRSESVSPAEVRETAAALLCAEEGAEYLLALNGEQPDAWFIPQSTFIGLYDIATIELAKAEAAAKRGPTGTEEFHPDDPQHTADPYEAVEKARDALDDARAMVLHAGFTLCGTAIRGVDGDGQLVETSRFRCRPYNQYTDAQHEIAVSKYQASLGHAAFRKELVSIARKQGITGSIIPDEGTLARIKEIKMQASFEVQSGLLRHGLAHLANSVPELASLKGVYDKYGSLVTPPYVFAHEGTLYSPRPASFRGKTTLDDWTNLFRYVADYALAWERKDDSAKYGGDPLTNKPDLESSPFHLLWTIGACLYPTFRLLLPGKYSDLPANSAGLVIHLGLETSKGKTTVAQLISLLNRTGPPHRWAATTSKIYSWMMSAHNASFVLDDTANIPPETIGHLSEIAYAIYNGSPKATNWQLANLDLAFQQVASYRSTLFSTGEGPLSDMFKERKGGQVKRFMEFDLPFVTYEMSLHLDDLMAPGKIDTPFVHLLHGRSYLNVTNEAQLDQLLNHIADSKLTRDRKAQLASGVIGWFVLCEMLGIDNPMLDQVEGDRFLSRLIQAEVNASVEQDVNLAALVQVAAFLTATLDKWSPQDGRPPQSLKLNDGRTDILPKLWAKNDTIRFENAHLVPLLRHFGYGDNAKSIGKQWERMGVIVAKQASTKLPGQKSGKHEVQLSVSRISELVSGDADVTFREQIYREVDPTTGVNINDLVRNIDPSA